MDSACVKGAQNDARITAIENLVKRDELEYDKKFTDFGKTLGDIRDRLLGRPSWAVTVILTVLTSTCVGLIVNILAK